MTPQRGIGASISLLVAAKNLGHSGTRMVEEHYEARAEIRTPSSYASSPEIGAHICLRGNFARVSSERSP